MKKQGSNRISHFAKVNENTVLECNNYIGRWSYEKNKKIGFCKVFERKKQKIFGGKSLEKPDF